MLTGVENCCRMALDDRDFPCKPRRRFQEIGDGAADGAAADDDDPCAHAKLREMPCMRTVARSGLARQDCDKSNRDVDEDGGPMTAEIAVIGGLRDGLIARLKESYTT